jgi:hypothetical protein
MTRHHRLPAAFIRGNIHGSGRSRLPTMRPVFRAFAVLLILPWLALASSVCAGPVTVDDAPGQTEGANGAPATLPGLLPAAQGEALLAPGGAAKAAAPAASASGDSHASSSAMAAEMLKEAEAGAAATEPPRKATRANAQAAGPTTASSASARNQARAIDDERRLREVGKAALHWLKETIPWLRSDADEGDGHRNGPPQAADWSASPLEGGRTGGNAFAGSPHTANPAGQVPPDPGSSVGYGSTAPPKFLAPEENIVQVFAKVVREVLEHPMTWLVVALVVVGAIAVKKFDRRPK